MKPFRPAGIHFRILAAAVILITGTTFALGFFGVSIIHEFVQSRFEERIAFMGKYLALNTELGILIDERSMLRRIARNLLQETDVVRVTVLNAEGLELADVTKEVPGPYSEVELPVYMREPEEEIRPYLGTERVAGARERIGQVRIVYSTKGIRELLSTMTTRFVWLSVGLAFFCAVVFYFISRSLVAPVSRLADAARQVAGGDLTLRVSPARLPEARELAVAFNAMLDSLESSQAALTRVHQQMVQQATLAELGKFSLMIAHEVKNPLGIIKSSVDLLKREVGSEPAHFATEYIEDEVGRLNHLIEDFLLFARPAVPNFREVDLNAMVRDHLERFSLQLEGHEPEIVSHIPRDACIRPADPDLLGRSLANVLKNAVEANDRRGRIEVDVAVADSRWAVCVKDEGPGVDPEQVDRLFEPFYTTRAKGTGLGLAFAYQVVKAHGGIIEAENHDSGGAVFRIALSQSFDEAADVS